MSIKNVTVVGAGTMGNGIAHTFAQSGYDVKLVDVNDAALAKGMETISSNLQRQVKKGTISEAEATAIKARISPSTDLAGSAKSADFIVEAATERFDLKRKIFET